MNGRVVTASPAVRSPEDTKAPRGEHYWAVWIVTAVLFGLSVVIAPGSVTAGSINAMIPFASILAIVAAGHTLVVQQRGIDMSTIGAVSLGGVLLSVWAAERLPFWPSVAAVLAVAAGVGLINGLLVARFKLTPIVATLAVNAIVVGAVRQISGGAPLQAPVEIRELAVMQLFGVPALALTTILFVALLALVMRYSIFGRKFVAVGVNSRSAFAAGIRADLYTMGAYAIAGACSAFAGILLSGYVGNASPGAGNDYLLPSIAAVVVGGTSLAGGRGSIVASAMAALFLTQLGQMVLSLGANSAIQLLIQAVVIVVAVAMRALRTPS